MDRPRQRVRCLDRQCLYLCLYPDLHTHAKSFSKDTKQTSQRPPTWLGVDLFRKAQFKQLQMALPAAASFPSELGRLAAGEWVESLETNFSWFSLRWCFVTFSRGFGFLEPSCRDAQCNIRLW